MFYFNLKLSFYYLYLYFLIICGLNFPSINNIKLNKFDKDWELFFNYFKLKSHGQNLSGKRDKL